MKLYDMHRAPNPRRVRMFLAEKKQLDQVEIIPVAILKGEHRDAAFKGINPMAQVPVLELEDGTTISESLSICRYLEHRFPEPALWGQNAQEMALIDMWNRRMELNGFSHVVGAYRHLSGAFASQEEVSQEWGKICLQAAEQWFEFLNQHLAQHDYIAGEKFSVADITVVCGVDFAKVVKLRVSEHQSHLKRWCDSMQQRASYSV